MNILDLPETVIEIIMSYLSYDDIAKNRIVCKKFNQINMNLLTHGFYKLLQCHAKALKRIKLQLPRRESERRTHPLSKHSDVLTCVETRLSMLSMTYQKYIQNGTACFIPGKVIDECFKILRLVSNSTSDTTRNMRAHEILQELRDISSMAIEHFDEKIVPEIKKNRPDANVSISSIYDMLTSPRPSFEAIHSFNLSRNSSTSSVSNKEDHQGVKTKTKLSSIVKLYKKQSKVIKSQAKQIAKMMTNMKSLKRRLDETEIKNREMVETVKQLKASQSVKKRTAAIILKRHLGNE